jgi:hypothetical protein
VPLRGVKPQQIEKRLKLFLVGEAKVGKTTAAIQFPNAYFIDTERGAENEQYVAALTKANSHYFATTDLDEIIHEVNELLTVRHHFRTLVIDPLTVPYHDACDKAARELAAASKDPQSDGMEFGRHKAAADRKMKRLVAKLLALDMNVVITSHQKDKWEKVGNEFRRIGATFDCYPKLDYLFDLMLYIERRGQQRIALVRGSRLASFPDGDSFEWGYAAVADRYGREVIEREAAPVVLASPEQVARLSHLVETVKLDESIVQKWLDKADVETFAEMPAEVVAKCIAYVEAKLAPPLKVLSTKEEVA